MVLIFQSPPLWLNSEKKMICCLLIFLIKRKIKPKYNYGWETSAWALFLRSRSALGHLHQAHTLAFFTFYFYFFLL